MDAALVFVIISFFVIYLLIGFAFSEWFLWTVGEIDKGETARIVLWPIFTIVYFLKELFRLLKSP